MRWRTVLSVLLYLQTASSSVLGVDYGTEFVKSSVVAPNAPFEIVLTPDSQRKDASGLIIKPDGERIYGSSGTGLQSRFPDASLYAVKPLLGVAFSDLRVGLFQETHPGLELVPTARNTVAFNVSGTLYPVEEVVAMQLSDIKQRATDLVKAKTMSSTARVRDVAISVPPSFGSAQRQALADAALLAETTLINLVSDSVAVALNYANSPAVASKLGPEKHYVCVYDAGASSATSALISLRQTNEQTVLLEVEGYGSDILLSGRGLTLALRELLFARFAEKTKVDRTARILNRLWREAERAKQVLSANSEVRIHVESLANDVDLDTKVTREQFEKLVAEHVEHVKLPLVQALGDLPLSKVDAVVLAGGTTRTPFVLEKLAETVGEQKLARNVNADEANTQGTSLRGVALSGIFKAKKKFVVVDRVPHSYSVALNNGDRIPQRIEIFGDLPKLDSEAVVELPRDIESLTLFEDSSKVVTWTLPQTKQAIDALYEPGPYTCVSGAKLTAAFGIDQNGIVRLKGVDAVCDSVRSETSTAATTTTTSAVTSAATTDANSNSEDEAQSTVPLESGTTEFGSDTTAAAEPSDAAETGSASTSATSSAKATIRPKTRRLTAKPNWEQGPIGLVERSDIINHLRRLDKQDSERQKHSVLLHELESLSYRIRGMIDEVGHEIVEAANGLLAWIEDGAGSIEELSAKLEEARQLHGRAAEATEQKEKNDESEDSTKDASESEDDESHDEL